MISLFLFDLQEREQQAQKKAEEANLTTSLTQKIKENFANALVFNTNMFETTLSSLYEKVSSYTGMCSSGPIDRACLNGIPQGIITEFPGTLTINDII